MKCNSCKKEMENDEIIYAPKKKQFYYWCDECYKKSKYYTEESYLKYKKRTKEILKEREYYKKLFNFFEQFEVLEPRFFTAVNDIIKGKYKRNKMFEYYAITIEELYDMTIRMEKYLKKIYNKKQSVYYLLAVVYNSYPKYLKWKKSITVKEQVIEIIDDITNLKKDNNKQENIENIDLDEFEV
jgi:hypothetical protein